MPRPTIRHVAQEAGVAIGTVSRVLNGSGPVGAATAARVRAAMHRLGYVPSAAGRSLRRGESRLIGIVVPTVSNPIFARSLEGIEGCARAAGLSTVVMNAGYDPAAEDGLARTLVGRGVDGLILTLAAPSEAGLARLAALGRPFVLTYNRPDGPAAGAALATVDSRAASRAATARILAFGHRRVAFLGGAFAASDRSLARYEGYHDAMAAAGLDPWPAEEVDFAADAPAFDAALERLVARVAGPTALLCSNDLLALQTAQAARRLGLAVPGDLSVVGFDGLPMARLMETPLATVRQPARSMGRAAAKILMEMMAGGAPRRVVMPTRFLDGGTLARAREAAGSMRRGSAPLPLPQPLRQGRTDRTGP